MVKFTSIGLLLVALVLCLGVGPAMAQGEGANGTEHEAPVIEHPLINLGSAFGAAVTIVGACWGIGKIGSAAVESMARQPEVAGDIRTAMVVAAAMIEGATLFALLIFMIK